MAELGSNPDLPKAGRVPGGAWVPGRLESWVGRSCWEGPEREMVDVGCISDWVACHGVFEDARVREGPGKWSENLTQVLAVRMDRRVWYRGRSHPTNTRVEVRFCLELLRYLEKNMLLLP